MANKFGLNIKVKTPHSTVSPKTMREAADLYYADIEKRATSVVTKNMARSFVRARENIYGTIAIFFQRVCSRTPLDEDYLIGTDESGNEVWHKADKNQCRMDWYIEHSGKFIKASQMSDEFPDIFDEFNNSEAIEEIKDMLIDTFGDDIKDFNFVIGNDNPHFATLEYGGQVSPFTGDDSEIKNGELYEHAVENHHSVQAPTGMLRITETELRSKSLRYGAKLQEKFNDMDVSKEPSQSELKAMVELMKKKRIKYGDINRYIRNYK